MTNFVKLPNLPDGRETVAAIGEAYSDELKKALKQYGVRVLSCPNNPFVDERLCSHIDLSVFHLGDNRFLLSEHASQSTFAEELIQLGAKIVVSEGTPGKAYPNDASLCALSLNGKVFHNEKVCDSHIKDLFGKNLFRVKQGYTKCAVCPIGKNAAICADRGVVKAMRQEGIEVLEIASGFISLEGFGEGFIGGAAFMLAPQVLSFTGTLENHPDKLIIENFLQRLGVSPVYLTDRPVFDVGSIIPVCEN